MSTANAKLSQCYPKTIKRAEATLHLVTSLISRFIDKRETVLKDGFVLANFIHPVWERGAHTHYILVICQVHE